VPNKEFLMAATKAAEKTKAATDEALQRFERNL